MVTVGVSVRASVFTRVDIQPKPFMLNNPAPTLTFTLHVTLNRPISGQRLHAEMLVACLVYAQ